MHLIIHLIIGILAGIALGLTGNPFWIFILASFLIDLDHITELNSKSFTKESIKKAFHPIRYRDHNYDRPQKSLHLFHSFEFIALLYLISLFYSPVFWIANAFLLHLSTDAAGNIWNRNIKKSKEKDWVKYWFVTYYMMKGSIYNKK
jgi:hypothetical protein